MRKIIAQRIRREVRESLMKSKRPFSLGAYRFVKRLWSNTPRNLKPKFFLSQ